MTRRVARAAGLVAAVLLATGCISTSDKPVAVPKEAARSNVQLGVAYMQQGNLALAKEKLDRAEQQDPRNVEMHTAQAHLNERLNRPAEAERYYRTALRLSPRNAEVANNFAVFLCKAGREDEALPLFNSAANDPLYSTPWAALTNAGVCLRGAKRTGDAIPLLERAVTMRPIYAEGLVELADAQLELGRADLSGILVDRYLGMGLASPEVLLVGVRAALARADQTAAENHARRLRRDFPNSAQTRALPQLMRTN